MKYEVIKLLQANDELDNFGRDMVKTLCLVEGEEKVVYMQHPVDNRQIDVGYTFETK
jgi:hypothetical protein